MAIDQMQRHSFLGGDSQRGGGAGHDLSALRPGRQEAPGGNS